MSEELIRQLKFDENGLITTIVQDARTNEVLTVAYMNAESLALTIQSGETWFWSRSRRELWHKGATSGNTQKVVDLRLDCDGDALLVRVEPAGPACHTGERSCFYRGIGTAVTDAGNVSASTIIEPAGSVSVVDMAALDLGILLQDLYRLIREREETRPEKSYTTYLFNQGIDKILKKVGEEAAETIIAAKNGDGGPLASEISDLIYHLLVLMVERRVSLADISNELASRAGRPALPKYGTQS